MTRTTLAALAALALTFGACGGDGPQDPGGGDATPLTDAQLREIEAAAGDETEESLAGLFEEDFDDPGGLAGIDAAPAASLPASAAAAECPLRSSRIPADPDGDRVPTSLTITFDPASCTRTGRDGGTATLFGVRRVSDPAPTVAGFDRDVAFERLGFELRRDGTTLRVTRDGTRSVRGGTGTLNATEDVTVARVLTPGGTASMRKQATAAFAPDAGETLAVGRPRPSGTLTLEGALAWDGTERDAVFTLTTVTPLHYDAACTDSRPAQRFDAGELRWARSVDGRSQGYLRVVFTGCGTRPAREWVEVPATSAAAAGS